MKPWVVVRVTFKFDLQHFVFVLDNVTVGIEGVTGTVHTDLQAKISFCTVQREEQIQSNAFYCSFPSFFWFIVFI